MKGLVLALISILCSVTNSSGQDLADQYLQRWQQFYPSKAVAAGFHAAIDQYENRSSVTIGQWIHFNSKILAAVSDTASIYVKNQSSNARLLRVQAQSEIDRWQTLKVHNHDLSLYLKLITRAIPSVLGAEYLTIPEMKQLIVSRLSSIAQLAEAAKQNLKRITQDQFEESPGLFKVLDASLTSLPGTLVTSGINLAEGTYEEQLQSAQVALLELSDHVSLTLSQSIFTDSKILGQEEYARQLALYTDGGLTPEELGELAMQEIQLVRQLMDEVATSYLKRTYRRSPVPKTFKARLEKALGDMEQDVPLNSSDYERFWQELADRAKAFVSEKGLGTLPENQTLTIQSAPESAGPAARIGRKCPTF